MFPDFPKPDYDFNLWGDDDSPYDLMEKNFYQHC